MWVTEQIKEQTVQQLRSFLICTDAHGYAHRTDDRTDGNHGAHAAHYSTARRACCVTFFRGVFRLRRWLRCAGAVDHLLHTTGVYIFISYSPTRSSSARRVLTYGSTPLPNERLGALPHSALRFKASRGTHGGTGTPVSGHDPRS